MKTKKLKDSALEIKDNVLDWASDPARVFNTLSIFLAGVLFGLLVAGYLK